MARPPRDPRVRRESPGQKPLLQGHLRRGATRPTVTNVEAAPEPSPPASPQPASEVPTDAADATRGKATRSPAEVATRPHLEGSEQGPM